MKWVQQTFGLKPVVLGALLALGAMLPGISRADVPIEDKPILVVDPLPPNLMFILDDSGSMLEDAMPEETNCSEAYSDNGKVINPSSGRIMVVNPACQSPDYNVLFYNPEVTYTPPVNADGSSISTTSYNHALVNGYYRFEHSGNSASVETPSDNRAIDMNQWITIRECDRYGYCNNTTYPFYYYRRSSSNYCSRNPTSSSCYTRVLVDSSSSAAERQNVANWYSYYRSRLMAAKAGISIAFQDIDPEYRVAYGSINARNVISRGLSRYAENKQQFYNWLFSQTSGYNYGTPLRQALRVAGNYFSTDEPYKVDLNAQNSRLLSCRQNFTILTTDGYWSGDTGSIGNVDSFQGPLHTSVTGSTFQYQPTFPFRDNYSTTLADIAMQFWKNDLAPNLRNDVPTSSSDPAFWQHMVTLGIGLGVSGTVNSIDAFNAIETGAYINWMNPFGGNNQSTSETNEAKINDLLHAAVNSRGGFYSAADPTQFVEGLKSALDTIQSHTGSGSSLAANSSSLTTNSMIYQASYRSGDWSGNLVAWPLDNNGNREDDAAWVASFPDAYTARNLFTISAQGNNFRTVRLEWGNLDSAEQSAIGSEELLNYLRGDQSREQTQNGPYRTRENGLLGDIVHSSPYYVGRPVSGRYANTGWSEASSYESFVTASASRSPLVLVGANDGYLHAFNGDTGVEVFAYLPREVILKGVSSVADPEYEHQFYMDGNAVVTDAYISGNWRTVAVVPFGRGGRGLVALDITDPVNVTALWELNEDNAPEIGYVTGTPVIAKLENNEWVAVVGNGYNSDGDKAQLLVIDLADGSYDAIDTGVGSSSDSNGLAGPLVWDGDDQANNKYDEAYAGDLAGNVWRFDLVNNRAERVFITNNMRPITADMTGRLHSDNRHLWLLFGTGRYLSLNDITVSANAHIDTWYGIDVDADGPTLLNANTVDGLAQLNESRIEQQTSMEGYTVRSVTEVDEDLLNGKRGWYIDLAVNGQAQGERMVLRNQVVNDDYLVGTTLIPIANECNPGGDGFIMAVNPFTGGAIDFFDLNGDGNPDRITLADGSTVPITGVSMGSTPSVPILVGNHMKTQLENIQVIEFDTIATGEDSENTRRISWREVVDQ